MDVPCVLGSRSTHIAAKLGGLLGRAVRAGDRLVTGCKGSDCANIGVPRIPKENVCSARQRIRMIGYPFFDRESDSAGTTLAQSVFNVSTESDRMGYRLLGSPITKIKYERWFSSAVVTGNSPVTE